MAGDLKPVALAVFLFFFLLVTVLGFAAARWRTGDLTDLHEWGLGGRRFGTVIAWFLIGGDFYTAYTIIAVPALVWGVGAAGFFSLPYTTILYTFVYVLMPRLWSVAHRHGYITAADFIQGRYGDRLLTFAVAATGILATMPYVALQLVGIQVVLDAMGLGGTGWRHEIPIVAAFLILALYTYRAGLRAPAMIAFVKDIMIFVMIGAAIIMIPAMLGGYHAIFEAAAAGLKARPVPGHLILPSSSFTAYGSLALGSALALLMYPHSVTGILSSAGPNVIRRNAALLPAYSLLLGLIALLGYTAIAAGIHPSSPNRVVPDLFLHVFPEWFAGFCFAAIGIGALVPAAVMSIAAANLFTRNIYKPLVRRAVSASDETHVAKLASLVIKIGAVAFIVFFPTHYAIELQLLGGVWILQTFPPVVLGLYGRWAAPRALLSGWACGMIAGTFMVVSNGLSAVYTLHLWGVTLPAYAALYALTINFAVAIITSLLPIFSAPNGTDETSPEDYEDALQQENSPA